MNRDAHDMFAALLDDQRNRSRWLYMVVSLLLHGVVLAAIWWTALPIVDKPSEMPDIDPYRTHYRIPELPEPPPPPHMEQKRRRANWAAFDPMKREGEFFQNRRIARAQRKRRKIMESKGSQIVASIPIPDDAHLPEGDLSVFFDSGEDHDDPGVPGGIEDIAEEFGGSAILGKGLLPHEKMEPPRWGAITPKLIKKVEPVYPKIAFRNRIEGDVRMVVLTDIYGKVSRIRVINGHPFLRKAARDAIRQWVYEPVVIDGFPKPVLFVVVVRFRMAP